MTAEMWNFAIIGAVIGLVVGVAAQVIMVAMAKRRRARDIVPIMPADGLVEHIDQWAAAHGYRRSQAPSGAILWRRGSGFFAAPRCIELVQDAAGQSLQAYIILNAIVMRGELALSESTFMAKPIRKSALKEFNDLLASLRLPQVTG